MPVRFEDHAEGWRPSWSQMIDIVERHCHAEVTAQELFWLREHPTDWLMTTRYMRIRVENDMAKSRKTLSTMDPVNPSTGAPSSAYLDAKRSTDRLSVKRLKWAALLDDQIAEAKHILGWVKIPADMRAHLVDGLLVVRTALTTAQIDKTRALAMVEGLIRTYAPDFDPDAYRPATMKDSDD